MTSMTGPDCAVMCKLINIHTYICTYIHTYIHTYIQCEWHRMTRMTGPDCVVMCNLINTYIHTYIHTKHTYKTYVHKIAVDAVRKTGETWVESGKNVEKKGLVQ